MKRKYKTFKQILKSIEHYLSLYDLTIADVPLKTAGFLYNDFGWTDGTNSHSSWKNFDETVYKVMKKCNIRGFVLEVDINEDETRKADFIISN